MMSNLDKMRAVVTLLEKAIEVRGGIECHGLEECLAALPRISRTQIDWTWIGYEKREPFVVSDGFARALERVVQNAASSYERAFLDDTVLVFGPDLRIAGSASFLDAWRGCTRMVEMSGEIDFSRATTLQGMLYDCLSLRRFNAAGYTVTAALTNMTEAFCGCTVLEALDLHGWHLDNVTSMRSAFQGCATLKTLDLRGDASHANDFSKNKDVTGLFNGCTSLEELLLPSNFVHAGITSLSNTLSNTPRLRELDVSGWDVSNVTSLQMVNCGIRDLSALGGWNVTAALKRWSFQGSQMRGTLDLSGWRIPFPGGRYCFKDCASLERLYINNMPMETLADVETGRRVYFSGCRSLVEVRLPAGFIPPTVQSLDGMFIGCARLEALDVSDWKLDSVTSIANLFRRCAALGGLDVSAWVTPVLTGMGYAFEGCASIPELDLRTWNTSKVTSMDRCFSGCVSLEEIQGTINLASIADANRQAYAFAGCTSLREVTLSNIRHNINISDSPLSAGSVHRLIAGVTANGIRLSLSSAAYNAWAASSYYEADMVIVSTKSIEIIVR